MNPDGPVQAGPGARSPSGKARQNLRGAAPRFRRNPLPPTSGAPHTPPEGAAGGGGASRIGPAGILSRYPQPESQYPSEAVRETDEALVTSTPILPTSCLPSWATKGPREAGPLRLLAQFCPAGVDQGYGLFLAIVCAGGGEKLGQDPPPTTAASGTPTAHPPLAPLTLLRRSPPRIRPWAGWSPFGGKSCFQRLF